MIDFDPDRNGRPMFNQPKKMSLTDRLLIVATAVFILIVLPAYGIWRVGATAMFTNVGGLLIAGCLLILALILAVRRGDP